MKISKIDGKLYRREKRLAFNTEPALTDEVWREFQNRTDVAPLWDCDNGLLIWKGRIDPKAIDPKQEFVDQTEQLLTEAETRVKNRLTREQEEDEKMLERLSKQTGRPVA